MESGPPSTPASSDTSRDFETHWSGTLLAAADVAGFRATADGTVTDANAAFAALTGYDRSDLLGTSFADLVEGEDALAALVSPPDSSIPPETPLPVPVSASLDVYTQSGSSISCTVHLDVLQTDDGEPRIAGIVDRRAGPAGSVESAASSESAPDLAASELDRESALESDADSGSDFESAVESDSTAEFDTESVSGPGLTYGKTFRALADALPDGIIVLDTDSDVQYANPAVERILGHDPDELVGSSKVNIIPPRLRQRHLTALKRYLETGERHLNWTYVELPGQHEDGHEVPLAVSLNDFTSDGDRYFVGLFRDISNRKEVERALTEKVVQLEAVSYLGRQALENADADELLDKAVQLVAAALDVESCAVFETEPGPGAGHTDRIRHETDSASAFRVRASVGCDDALLETEAAIETDGDRSPDSSAAAINGDSLAATTLAANEPVIVESVANDDRFDGPTLAERGVQSGLAVTIGPADDPWGVLGIYDDQRREFAAHAVDFAESAATILATGIERRQYERRLSETVDELEASNERLEQFAYAASHDLQEPLRMISSYLQLVEDRYADDLDSDGREFIEFAVDGAERMREMIDGLLEYSRVETQGDPFEDVDLDDVVDDVLTDLQVKIEDTDAEVATESLPAVRGDASQLRQLFQNLLANAIEYSGDDPPQVRVTADRVGQRWELSVHDEGIGIDPEDADRIFQVFQRLHGREEYSGTGIGLALCRRIVERHGGRIWVDSEPGEGATFTFTLPATGSTAANT